MHLAEERDFVFARKPLLGKLYTKYKDAFWPQYLTELYQKLPKSVNPIHASRFDELAQACKRIAAPLLGEPLTQRVISSLRSRRFVNTSDHHGVLCHPFFLNFNLLRAIFFPDEPVISFTCGGTSFSNSSYPRGIFFHDAVLNKIQIPFIPWKYRQTSIYGHPALTKSDFERLCRHISSLNMPHEQQSKFTLLYKSFQDDDRILGSRSFSDQCSIMTQKLWEVGRMPGDMIYLECESIVRALFLNTHLIKDTLINKILFNQSYRDAYLKYFEGITGAHFKAHGTQLFWYVDHKKMKKTALEVAMIENQYILQSIDRTINIPLTPEEIRGHLQNHTLLPCLALCYSMISFYYGITLGGGFSQIQYLGDMKNAWNQILISVGDSDKSIATDIPTDIFTGDFVIAGICDSMRTVPATLLDIFLWGDTSTSQSLKKVFGRMTVGECLDIMIPQLRHTLSPASGPMSNAPDFPASLYVK